MDLVIDVVGAGTVQDNIDAAAITGRIVCLGRLAGTEGTFNLDEFARKRIRMIGVTFRTRTFEERAAAIATFREQMLDRLALGAIRPVIDRSFPFTAVDEAERYMRDNRKLRKGSGRTTRGVAERRPRLPASKRHAEESRTNACATQA